MRNEALKRIGYLFPPAKLPDGTEATVIANLWTHTVKCPNPACGAIMPLLTSFILSSRKGVYIIPKTNNKTITYSIDTAPPKNIKDPKRGMKRGMSGIFECIFCGTITTRDYVSNEGKAKRIGIQPIAIIVDGPKGRLYLPPDAMKYPSDIPKPDLTGLEYELARNPRDVWCRNFGLTTPVDLFTPRQLLLLKTYSGLVYEMRERVIKDGQGQQTHPDYKTIEEGGTGLNAYADAVALYLGLAVSRLSDNNSLLVIWSQSRDQLIHTFGRQALPMVWDFAESNTFSMSAGDISITLDSIIKSIQALPINITAPGKIEQMDAKSIAGTDIKSLISTDPPYYDNIGYADLSDFFYVWLRLSLGKIFRNLFSTVLVPKEQELVAIPYRFGNNKLKAQIYFKEGLEKTFLRFHNILDQNYPMTIFYAFKQAEIEEEEISHNIIISSTGWETMLESIISTGYIITGTWPMRTERGVRMVSLETNALASSIVLVCRPRLSSAPIATRREFLTIIRKELPMALKKLQEGNIAPVDLAQAAIGPGMEIFSRYSKVIEANGIPMNIRTALQIINQELETFLKYEEVDIDSDTQFLIAWFEQYGINEGPFGTADVLARAKNTSVEGLTKTGALTSKGGKVALRSRNDYDPKWDPATDSRLTLWECTQYLIKRLKEGGESAAADLFSRLGTGKSEDAKNLAYRLYRTCEYKGWMDEARAYNELVIAWPEIQKAAAGLSGEGPQKKLDVGERGNNK
jgi:putative DNA methylase